MKLYVLVIISALQLSVISAEKLNPRHHHLQRRAASAIAVPTNAPSTPSQVPVISPLPPSTSSTSPPPAPPPAPPAPPPAPPPSPASSTSTTSAATGSSTTSTASGSSTLASATTTTATGPPPLDTGTGVPPLANITLGMPTQAPIPVPTVYPPGTTPPISGAPVLPPALVLGSWPPLDKRPDTGSIEVQTWMNELEGFYIPDIPPTADGSCAGDPNAAAEAANNGWWTCGGYTRDTDIVSCPDYLTWGVSFDDGPSLYSMKLLNFLEQKDITATFFAVGSRVVEYPNVLIEEYMSGHEIAVHTWSHPPLTSLTNEEIVAELGWTRKAIKAVLGVTPTLMRPPYGDIDDRVRAISLAMGLVPVIWSQTKTGAKFDTNDWRVAAGSIPGNASLASFEQILNNATTLDSGFIVLEHDLFEITVDLAVGYTLDAALTFVPKLNLEPIGKCTGLSNNIYRETNTNTSFPYHNQTTGSNDGTEIDGDSNGNSVASGVGHASGAGFVMTIPVWSSLTLAAIAALSSIML